MQIKKTRLATIKRPEEFSPPRKRHLDEQDAACILSKPVLRQLGGRAGLCRQRDAKGDVEIIMKLLNVSTVNIQKS